MNGITAMKRTALPDCVTGRARVGSHGVNAVTSARFKERIVAGAERERDGVVAFRGVDAQRILKEEFDIECSLSSTYRLRRLRIFGQRDKLKADRTKGA